MIPFPQTFVRSVHCFRKLLVRGAERANKRKSSLRVSTLMDSGVVIISCGTRKKVFVLIACLLREDDPRAAYKPNKEISFTSVGVFASSVEV